MNRLVNRLLCAAATVCACLQPMLAQQQPHPTPGTTPKISACSLLTREEVKKHLPWAAMVDQLKTEEEALGNYGSACNYPSVYIQLMPFRQSLIDTAQKKGALEPAPDVGDEAYLHDNRGRYAELYVKVGDQLLTLQADIPMGQKIDSVRPGVLSLAKALVAKLR